MGRGAACPAPICCNPFREGQNVRLVLPRDLKKAVVRRLAAFMSALAVDGEESER